LIKGTYLGGVNAKNNIPPEQLNKGQVLRVGLEGISVFLFA